MDITNSNVTHTVSELGMAIEAHLVHDQHPFDTIWPSYPHQTHQIPSLSSNQIPTISIFSDQIIENCHQIGGDLEQEQEQEEELGAMKEMMYKIAAMQPVDIDPSTIRKPKRRNVKISDDPQSVAARHRRERISEKIRILQRLVPGGTKLDTASMLDEAIQYVKFLKRQIRQLQCQSNNQNSVGGHFSSTQLPEFGSTGLYSVEPPSFRYDGSGNCELTFFQNEVIN